MVTIFVEINLTSSLKNGWEGGGGGREGCLRGGQGEEGAAVK